MLAAGPVVARWLMDVITVLTLIIMVGGLTPKFWRRKRRTPGC